MIVRQLEYIVDENLAHEVLTTNTAFSFEEGTAYVGPSTYLMSVDCRLLITQVLNLHLFHKLFTAFFVELDDLVRNVIISRMPLVVERGMVRLALNESAIIDISTVFPAFMRHADALMHSVNFASAEGQETRFRDALDFTHSSISEAMAIIILGPVCHSSYTSTVS